MRTRFRPATLNLIGHQGGAFLPLVALAMVPLLGVVGLAADYSSAALLHTHLQNATDATALAVCKQAGALGDAEVGDLARSYFKASIANSSALVSPPVLSAGRTNITINATAHYSPFIMNAAFLGGGGLKIVATSTCKSPISSFEVAFVLDNSGSMRGQPMADLKAAAKAAVTELFKGQDKAGDRIKVAVVPFGSIVNVGSDKRSASWMDKNGRSKHHWDTILMPEGAWPAGYGDKPTSRFSLFDQLRDPNGNPVPWLGCVEVRGKPHDITDTAASETVPESLFVPMLAPDEPDPEQFAADDRIDIPGKKYSGGPKNGLKTSEFYSSAPAGFADRGEYKNNYLSDLFSGLCKAEMSDPFYKADKPASVSGGHSSNVGRGDQATKMCKYLGAPRMTKTPWPWSGLPHGPNAKCDVIPLMPLGNRQADLIAKIDSMFTVGSTNIHEGVMWGWRVLSRDEPFAEGRPYDAEGNTKIMVVMTDGENMVETGGNHENGGPYSAYGYLSRNRTSSTNANPMVRMNDLTAAACKNAKATGIQVYTIALGLSSSSALKMIGDCASSKDKFHVASTSGELGAIFGKITNELGQLRLTH